MKKEKQGSGQEETGLGDMGGIRETLGEPKG